jgi:hypothetical protein
MTFVTLMFILGGLLLLFSAIENKPIVDYAKELISTGKVPK